MTRTDEIRELFAYNRWANLRILDAAAALDDERLTRDLGSSFPSILATLAHIVVSDWIWLRRWSGESPAEAPEEWDLSGLDAVRSRWNAVEAERSGLLDTLEDAGLDRVVTYRNRAGKTYTSRMDEMLRHVVNHSTYHRGQVTTMLRQVGGPTVATDLIAWYRERA